MSKPAKSPGEYGGTIRCMVCNSETSVTEREKPVHSNFSLHCAYCMWMENQALAEELLKVTKQRDALVLAIDIARTVKRDPKP